MSKTERHTASNIQSKQSREEKFEAWSNSIWFNHRLNQPEERHRKTTIAEAQPKEQEHETSTVVTKNMN